MAIHTQESLSGFIASDPLLTQTAKGDARFFARIGKEHFRREEDGSFTQTETTYHHLVMFGRSAEHAHANFVPGDNFVAEGYTREVNYERNSQSVENEEFVAKIDHDAARRLCNQAFFTKVFIDEDGELRAQRNRPFEMLLDPEVNANALTWAANADRPEPQPLIHRAKVRALCVGCPHRDSNPGPTD